jgi:hypothetical protein
MKYLLFVFCLVGCQPEQPWPSARAAIPPQVEAPKPPKVDIDTALWHLRYAHGLLEKKQ